jgi:hypothetical protein
MANQFILEPTITGLGRPLKLYQYQIDSVVATFVTQGYYVSPSGGTLWPVLDHCHRKRIPYVLTFLPNHGWRVEQTVILP